jgi:NAD(P)H-quinone oxidoreductase subunit 5
MQYVTEVLLMLILVPPFGLALGCMLGPLVSKKDFRFLVALRTFEFICATLALVLCLAGVTQEYNVSSSILGFRADLLSTSVLASITLLSLCIFRYSLTYLNGDPHRGLFLRNFQWTVFSIAILTIANNLLLFFIAWLGTSWGLDRLLRHFRDRPNAILAARKKWLISRAGDIAILSGIIYLWFHLGTFNYGEIFAIASQSSLPESLHVKHVFSIVSLLFVFGAMTKSAQFPFHFWLPETMETPTPVSALMHAGIINAGGFLLYWKMHMELILY